MGRHGQFEKKSAGLNLQALFHIQRSFGHVLRGTIVVMYGLVWALRKKKGAGSNLRALFHIKRSFGHFLRSTIVSTYGHFFILNAVLGTFYGTLVGLVQTLPGAQFPQKLSQQIQGG